VLEDQVACHNPPPPSPCAPPPRGKVSDNQLLSSLELGAAWGALHKACFVLMAVSR